MTTDAEGAGPADPDLGSLLARILPTILELEEPILFDAGLSMWEYSILTALAPASAVSQVELSERTRRDPTRLGRHLEDLVARGLVERSRATDGRQRTVGLTAEGRGLLGRTRSSIRRAEERLLGTAMPDVDSVELRRLLALLASGPSD